MQSSEFASLWPLSQEVCEKFTLFFTDEVNDPQVRPDLERIASCGGFKVFLPVFCFHTVSFVFGVVFDRSTARGGFVDLSTCAFGRQVLSYQDSLPLHDYFSLLDDHFGLRTHLQSFQGALRTFSSGDVLSLPGELLLQHTPKAMR